MVVLAETDALLHHGDYAVKAFDLAQPDTELAKALVAAARLTYRAAENPALRRQAVAAVDALRERPDLDPGSASDLIQLYLVLGEGSEALNLLPTTCAAQPVNCSDLNVNPEFLPLRGQPRFEELVKRYDTISKPVPAGSAAPSSA